MIKIVVLGAGSHSQHNHLPALARYVSAHPGRVLLAGLCDLRVDHAKEMAAQYGFARAYSNLDEMLHVERPDGCIAVTPIPVTLEVASRIARAGVPLLIEKPPGATATEAQALVDLVREANAQVMVSVNRRFDPALNAALDWWGERRIEHLHARIVRVRRCEPEFMYGTAIHPLDAMRAIAGDVACHSAVVREVEGVRWYVVRMAFESGATGVLEVMPTAGCLAESYEWFGHEARVWVGTGDADRGLARAWELGEQVLEVDPSVGQPLFVRNGTYAETEAFISALVEGRTLHPAPAEVLQSVELCECIQEEET